MKQKRTKKKIRRFLFSFVSQLKPHFYGDNFFAIFIFIHKIWYDDLRRLAGSLLQFIWIAWFFCWKNVTIQFKRQTAKKWRFGGRRFRVGSSIRLYYISFSLRFAPLFSTLLFHFSFFGSENCAIFRVIWHSLEQNETPTESEQQNMPNRTAQ